MQRFEHNRSLTRCAFFSEISNRSAVLTTVIMEALAAAHDGGEKIDTSVVLELAAP